MKNFQVTNLADHIENGELFLTENLAGTKVGICDAQNVHYKFGKYKGGDYYFGKYKGGGTLVELSTTWVEDDFEYVEISKVLDIENVWHMDNNYKNQPNPEPDNICASEVMDGYALFNLGGACPKFYIEADSFKDKDYSIRGLGLDSQNARLLNYNGYFSPTLKFTGMLNGLPVFKAAEDGDAIIFIAGFWDSIPKNSLDKLREVSKQKEVVTSEKKHENGSFVVEKYTLPTFIWQRVRNQKGMFLALFHHK